jgi:hypothetical protein
MWEDRLQDLLEFRRAHGHVNVPRSWSDHPRLAHWVVNQRRLLRLGKLSADRRARLEKLGIRWLTADERRFLRDREWDRMCDALLTYVRVHGHSDVPGNGSANPELAKWVTRQRHELRTGGMREDRHRRLGELGIEIGVERGRSRNRDRAWERLFKRLEEFRRANGSCNVPKNWPDNPTLARWVAHQRSLMRHRAMRSDRRTRLEELGLGPVEKVPARRRPPQRGATARRTAAWRNRLDSLALFRSVHGHSNVPRRWPQDPALARWVSRQRELRRQGRLAEDRVALLDGLKFSWSGSVQGRDSAWERGYDRLVAFRRDHGHCNVPARWRKDPSLGRWVVAQRSLHRGKKLASDRVRQLKRLGLSM